MTEWSDLTHVQRVRLDALRYASGEEAATYLAIMRSFTGDVTGLLSDQSASEIAGRLAELGIELPTDTVDDRLSYLVEHGNLARSPRETEARSLREYLQNRARYQLTQRGEMVHRFVEELLGHTESAREVSTEMLGGILTGLDGLARVDPATADPDTLAREIGTMFAQFERLVSSTRDFYTYLAQVLVRYDLDRGEFETFKTALLDYLQRFVDEIARHTPQIAEALLAVEPSVPELCARANSGRRLLGVDGERARRSSGLEPEDWSGLHAWFVGGSGRDSDAAGVRRLATEAMRALLVNLRRIAKGNREQSRYADLLTLAGWFAEAEDDTAHALWASAFGLFPCRHLAFAADDDDDPVPATASWWRTPVADVPLVLRRTGARRIRGRAGRREDFAVAKAARIAERERAERARAAALSEIEAHRGALGVVRLSDEARAVLLALYAQALVGRGRPLGEGDTAETPTERWRLVVGRSPGTDTVIVSPEGRLELAGLTLSVVPHEAAERRTG
ncbi:TIGR02677 family protein [Pseudonocardia sp. RS11V-5]|uniref:TIGR02677 family protein n=1 Tax=Pseudonocardia terrae TaxID=2905831 RepID=UPI001E33D0B5|nr:TIGR02677 family protein [Pseudonocardia terrae]MCE3550174.1 TIGR02677 family protein [Pseudonocardia terrae]